MILVENQLKGLAYRRICMQSDKLNEENHTLKTHTNYEILYLEKGNAVFIMNQLSFPMPEDSIILIPPNIPHTLLAKPETEITFSSIMFTPEIIPAEHRFILLRLYQENILGKYSFYTEISESRLPVYIENLMDTVSLAEEIQPLFSAALIETILAYLLSMEDIDTFLPSVNRAETERLTKFVEDHIAEPLTLKRITADLDISKDKINRICKETLGMSITEYIQSKRIMMAQEKIRRSQTTTSDNITQIAKEVGYTTYSTFYRAYQRVLGYSPAEEKYKKRISESEE
ncbi:MAG: AraC family transcriptional regulator [Lachnospiraceae bacterium]